MTRYLSSTAVWVVCACLTWPAIAAEVPSVDTAGNLGRMLLALGAVVALVLALAWVARRMSGLRGLVGAGATGPIQVLAQRALGTRERLLLVEVDGKRLLLGVVPGSITCLYTGDPPAEDFVAQLDAAKGEPD